QPERDLLLAIAGHSLQQQAGYVPSQTLDPLPLPASLSERPACNVTAQQHLKLMLNHSHEQLLPYWLDALHNHQQRIPNEMLPAILNYGRKQADHHHLLRNAIGERGQWLAQASNNKFWKWILQNEPDLKDSENGYIAWENYFKRLRQQDPHYALQVIEAYWEKIDIYMQMAIMRSMQLDLNPEDEGFLMRTLQNPLLKDLVAGWLIELETSEFSRIARQQIGQILHLAPIGKDDTWVVDFTWTKTFEGHPAHISKSQAVELCQIMGYQFEPEIILEILPLSYWYDRYDVSPEILIQAASQASRPSIFYRIWANSAIQVSDGDFLFALAMTVKEHPNISFVKHLTQAQLIEAATYWLRSNPIFSLDHNATILLGAIETIWSHTLTEVFLDSLKAFFEKVARPLLESDIRETLKQYARLIPLDFVQRFEEVLHIASRDELSDTEIEQLNGIIDIMHFRISMMQAIKAGAPHTHIGDKS
ncbi:MAG: DUF5691 domain-containing protein, partial [Chloroflexota bacterium]